MAAAPGASAQEWKANWPLVLAATFGLSFGAMPTSTLGLFMDPLQDEFGWSRSEMALGMTIFALITTPLTPFAGALIDRYGARAVGLPGIALTGLMFAAFALLGGALWHWLLAWVFYSMVSLGIRTPVWNSAVSASFSAGRGLAIAIVLSGMAVTQMLAPAITHWLVDNHGWRFAYAVLGIGWGGIAFLLVLLFFHDARSRQKKSSATCDQPAARMLPGGMTLREAVRNPRILRIAFATLLQSLIGAAVAVHLVPLLGSTGLSRAEAAGIAGVLGAGSFIGKLLSGWLVDRYTIGILPFAVFAMPGVCYLLLLLGDGSIGISSLAIFIAGLGGGASLQITIYLTTRYAGIAHFGKIFGTISSLMGLAGGIGPLVGGIIFDTTGSYAGLLLIAIPMTIIAGISVSGLGPYPVFDPVYPNDSKAGLGNPSPA